MTSKQRKYRVLIAYNDPDKKNGDNLDYISEAAVKTEADNIYKAVLKLDHIPGYLPVSNIEKDIQKVKEFAPDMIFNLCEGYRGDAHHEMHIAGFWELLGIPYTGNTPLTLGLAQNKVLAKKLFESKKIPTPMYQVYSETPKHTYLNYPLIAKPAREDASIGITQRSIIHNFEELSKVVAELLKRYKQPVLVEKFIQGREFNVSVLGNNPAKVLPVSEINFAGLEAEHHHITSYEAKWLPHHPLFQKTPAVCPADISQDLRQRLADVTLQVYHLLMGRDYGRVDIRVDSSGRIYVLEFNPNPDISMDAGFANAVKAAGMKYREFVDFIINQTMNRMAHD